MINEQRYDLHNLDTDTWIRNCNLAQVLNNISLSAQNFGFSRATNPKEDFSYWWYKHYELFEVETIRTKVVNNETIYN